MEKPRQAFVFLSHNSSDKPEIDVLASRLEHVGVRVFFDKWDLQPGQAWQPALEKALDDSTAVLVCIGPHGIGPWQDAEMRAAIARRVEHPGFPVIPVLLPKARRGVRSELPKFLVATTWVEFRGSMDDDVPFQRLLEGLDGSRRQARVPYRSGTNPYRGLASFDEAHAPYFFGREALTQRMVEAIRPRPTADQGRFLAVVGPSGSGKSSLVRAGLIPALRAGAQDSARWPIVFCRPGGAPLANLAASLKQALVGPVTGVDGGTGFVDEDALRARLAQDDEQLHRIVMGALQANIDRRLLVVVDPLEECFTRAATDPAEYEHFLASLLHAGLTPNGQTIVVALLRADFYPDVAAHPQLASAVAAHQLLVGPMEDHELRRAIEEPARLTGVAAEPGLADLLIRDVDRQPGALPLLQHVLETLWDRAADSRLTIEAYRDIGRLDRGLAEYAEKCFGDLPLERQEAARTLFLNLINIGFGADDTKLRRSLSELTAIPQARTLIADLAQARLLTTFGNDEGASVEIAHEALARAWPRLSGWIKAEREGLRLHGLLRGTTSEWLRTFRNPTYLYEGTQLAIVSAHAEKWEEGRLSDDERAFLQASADREASKRQTEVDRLRSARDLERQAARRLRRLATGLALVGVLAVGAAVVAWVQRRVAVESTRVAQLNLAKVYEEQLRATLGRLTVNDRREDAQDATLLALAALEQRSAARDPAVRALPKPLQVALLKRDVFARAFAQAWVSPSALDATSLALRFDVQGRLLASSSVEKKVNLWDVETGQQVALLQSDDLGYINRVVFGPSGDPNTADTVATADQSGQVFLWRLPQGRLLYRVARERGGIHDLAYHPRKPILAYAESDRFVLWDIAERREVWAHKTAARTMAFTNEGRYLALLTEAGAFEVWDVETRQKVRVFGLRDGLCCATLQPRGRLVAAAVGGRIVLWNRDTNVEEAEFIAHDEPINDLVFSPDGTLLASASDDCSIRVWAVASHQMRHELKEHGGRVLRVAFRPDADMLASSGADHAIRLWDLRSGRAINAYDGHSQRVLDVRWSTDRRVIGSWSRDRTIRLWSPDTGASLHTFKLGPQGGRLPFAVGPQGRAVAFVRRRAAPAHREVVVKHRFGGPDQRYLVPMVRVSSLEFADDGQHLVATGTTSRARIDLERSVSSSIVTSVSKDKRALTAVGAKIQMFDSSSIATGRVSVQTSTLGLSAATVGPDAREVALGYASGSVTTIALTDPPSLETQELGTSTVTGLAFGRGGRLLVIGDEQGDLQMFDRSTREVTTTRRQHRKAINHVAISADGRFVVSAGLDRAVRIGDLESETSKVFRPDGFMPSHASGRAEHVVVANYDPSSVPYRAWHYRTGRALPEPEQLSIGTSAVASRGDLVATSSFGGIRLWSLKTGRRVGILKDGVGTEQAESWALDFGPKGRLLAASAEDKGVKIYDVTQRLWLTTLQTTSLVVSMRFDPHVPRLVAVTADAKVWQWDLSAFVQVLALLKGEDPRLHAQTKDATTFLWEKAVDGIVVPHPRTPSIRAHGGYLFASVDRLVPLLAPPRPGENKLEHVLRWSREVSVIQ